MRKKVEICGVDTSQLPKYTADELKSLLVRSKNGDKTAREQLVNGNLLLVLSLVQRYRAKSSSPDDLFQIGCVGLIKAIDNFDERFNVKFSTYAVPMILGEIRRFIRESNSLRVSRGIRDVAYSVMQAKQKLEEQGLPVSLNDIADYLKISSYKVVYCMNAISDTLSLSEPVFSDEEDTFTLADQLFDKRQDETSWAENVCLADAFATLNDREKDILYKRYFQGKTQTEISDEIGISQAQISRLEKNAINSLRFEMRE